jgi:hypothetical protein
MIKQLSLMLALAAFASVSAASDAKFDFGKPDCRVYAPEIDPASSMTGLTLLGGVLMLLRKRKSK